MNTLLTFINQFLPGRIRHSQTGWRNFNGPCCVHNGQRRPDNRTRAGIVVAPDGGISYSCFNCGYKTGWSPGRGIGDRLKQLLRWWGADEQELKKLSFDIYRENARLTDLGIISPTPYTPMSFTERPLPDGAMPFSHWVKDDNPPADFLDAIQYVAHRGDVFLDADLYWTPDTTHSLNRRVIIPFKWRDVTVGWTCRAFDEGLPRYYSEQPPNFLFNTSAMYRHDRELVIVTEGPFDALAIDGVSTLGAKISSLQEEWLNQCGKQVVILPDRDQNSRPLIDAAIRNKWYVSFPWGVDYQQWEEGIKDAADAVKKYGRLYALYTIVRERTNNPLKINVMFKNLLQRVEVTE